VEEERACVADKALEKQQPSGWVCARDECGIVETAFAVLYVERSRVRVLCTRNEWSVQ
jgi:hypothetical protein